MQITTWEFSHTDDGYMLYLKIEGTRREFPLPFSVTAAVRLTEVRDSRLGAQCRLVQHIDDMMQVFMDRVKHEVNVQNDQRRT